MPTSSYSPTRALAHFAVHGGDFPPTARARAVHAITDCVGCMLAGGREPLAEHLLGVLATRSVTESGSDALLVGTSRHATPADAALYNGAVAHALDFDDTNHPAYAHPSAVIVPVLLALASRTHATGDMLVTAYVVGLEAFGKLGRALNNAHYKRGWHATATFGALAAALVAGRLLRLDVAQMTTALGIAASSAGGLRANFGAMVKPLHAGQAARNGVFAALLAREGFTATQEALEHPYGFCGAFNGGLPVDLAPFAALGDPLEILTDYGLALKMYPACGATHPGIEAALMLHDDLRGASIRSVRAGVCEMALAPLIHVMPESPLEGKFSLHYCLAAALLDGCVNLATFTPGKIADPRLRALILKIRMEVEPQFRDASEFPTVVSVETDAGGRLERTVLLARGKPARWFTAGELREKFDDCASSSVSVATRARLFALLQSIDRPIPCDDLLAALQDAAADGALPDFRAEDRVAGGASPR